MREKDIHEIIEQQNPEAKKCIWEKVCAQLNLAPVATQQITLFTFVKAGDGYDKKPITLLELLARLSDKKVDVARGPDKNITQQSDDKTLATSEPTRSTNGN